MSERDLSLLISVKYDSYLISSQRDCGSKIREKLDCANRQPAALGDTFSLETTSLRGVSPRCAPHALEDPISTQAVPRVTCTSRQKGILTSHAIVLLKILGRSHLARDANTQYSRRSRHRHTAGNNRTRRTPDRIYDSPLHSKVFPCGSECGDPVTQIAGALYTPMRCPTSARVTKLTYHLAV